MKWGALRMGHVSFPMSSPQLAHGVSPGLYSFQADFGWGWRVQTHLRVSKTVTDWQGKFCVIYVLISEFIWKLKLKSSYFQTLNLKKRGLLIFVA